MKDLIGEKIYITATIGREGYKNDGTTICLVDIRYDGIAQKDTLLRDHLWINKTMKFKKLKLKMGDRIELSGVVTPYESNDGMTTKYRLSQLKHMAIAGSAEIRINERLSEK